MLDWSMRQTEHPVAIRVPAAEVARARDSSRRITAS